MVTLESAGMRDDDICLSFVRMIRGHIEKSTGREPLSFSELINNLKSHQPLQPLFNTISCTLKPKAGMTSFGYVKVESKFLADRIWSISSDCESLIKKRKLSQNHCSKYDCEWNNRQQRGGKLIT